MTIKDDNADTMLYITDGCFKFKIMITSIDENNSRGKTTYIKITNFRYVPSSL
jgi:hypothetical protein